MTSSEFLSIAFRRRVSGIFTVCICVTGLSACGSSDLKPATVRVPNVVGHLEAAAAAELTANRLRDHVKFEPFAPLVAPPPFSVMWQTPAAGTVVPTGSVVDLGVRSP
jgi:beta-lactam-binding protein with PASTA domain